jgi:hypothetical protein
MDWAATIPRRAAFKTPRQSHCGRGTTVSPKTCCRKCDWVRSPRQRGKVSNFQGQSGGMSDVLQPIAGRLRSFLSTAAMHTLLPGWVTNSPKRCVQVESAAHSRPVVTGARRHSHFVPRGDITTNYILNASDVQRSVRLPSKTLRECRHPCTAAQCQFQTHAPQQAASSIGYSITSSATASTPDGMVRPSALAVLRLMTSSYFVGVCTGKSAGFSPLRMRSTYPAASRNC